MPVRIEEARLSGFEMRYVKFGRGKRIMVILPGLSIHSVVDSADMVANAYKVFDNDFSVYVFDRRLRLPEKYLIEDMARDTARVMESLGLSDVCLFGASHGGMMAQCIACEKPRLVSRLALGSTCVRIEAGHYKIVENWVRLAERGDGEALYLNFGSLLYPPESFSGQREALAKAGREVTEDLFKRFVALAGSTKGFDILSRVDKIKCPVLFLGASDDAVLGKDSSDELIRAYQNRPAYNSGGVVGSPVRPVFQYHMYTGYGHAAFDTAPDYKDRLLKFFKEPFPAF